MKRIVVINPDGTETTLSTMPNLNNMQSLMGGYIELVTVLDHIEGNQPIYTYMVVNEDGMGLNLPRNPQATEIYQRNARWQFPKADNPFQAMTEAFRAQLEHIGATMIDMTIDASDPPILGPAIYFEGYTVEEVNHLMDEEEGK